MEEEIILREKEKSFHISRIPRQTKEEIIEFADDEFCGDYGMALKTIWDNFKIWKIFFENIDMKLDKLLENNQPEPEEKDSLTMLSGKRIQKGGKS